MPKIMMDKVAKAVSESVLKQLMPELDKRFDSLSASVARLENDLRAVDAKVDTLRNEMLDRFERTLETIKEVAHRVTRVEGKLEGYMEAINLRLMPPRIERRRKAG